MTDRILIVEDERDLLTTLRYNLEREGFETLGATTGAQALDLLSRQVPDLVLLDL
ncbi:MAG: response regulator, partial [Myxococcales bacterium]|nr:response regulator [Myxococcales bacterium]